MLNIEKNLEYYRIKKQEWKKRNPDFYKTDIYKEKNKQYQKTHRIKKNSNVIIEEIGILRSLYENKIIPLY